MLGGGGWLGYPIFYSIFCKVKECMYTMYTCLAIVGWQLKRLSHDTWCYMTFLAIVFS
jgi:hypothetical protein